MWSKLAYMPGRSAPKRLAWSCGSGLKGFITCRTAPSVYAAANGSSSSCQLLRLLSFLFFTLKTKTKMANKKKKKKNPGWLFLRNFLQWCLSFWFFYFLNAKRKGDTWIYENNVQKAEAREGSQCSRKSYKQPNGLNSHAGKRALRELRPLLAESVGIFRWQRQRGQTCPRLFFLTFSSLYKGVQTRMVWWSVWEYRIPAEGKCLSNLQRGHIIEIQLLAFGEREKQRQRKWVRTSKSTI